MTTVGYLGSAVVLMIKMKHTYLFTTLYLISPLDYRICTLIYLSIVGFPRIILISASILIKAMKVCQLVHISKY